MAGPRAPGAYGSREHTLGRRLQSARPRAGERQGRERDGASHGPSAPSGPSRRSSAGRPSPSHPSAVPALTSGRESAGCEGCWGAASRPPAGLSGGQRQRGRSRGRCSWLVALRALRLRPRRRLPPRPLRGLRAGMQLTPQPRSPPPLRLLGRGWSRLQRRPASSGASGSQRRPAPGPGVAAPPHWSAPRSQPAVTQATGPRNFLPRGDHPKPGPAAKGTSFRTRKKISRRFPAGPLRPLRRPPGGQCRGNRLGLIPSPIPNNARKTRGFPALGARSTTAAPPLGKLEGSSYP